MRIDGERILAANGLMVRRGGVQVLDIPSLAIEQGKCLTLIGPNGAGKSTLLLALACLIKPSTGTLAFKGQRLASDHDLFAYRRRVAMVFQEPLLFDTTVFENIAAGLKLRKVKHAEVERRVREYAQQFGIMHLLQRSARKVSGGEAQRTSLARAFSTQPEIIFLDEPFSSLDPPTRDSLIEDLHRILHETQTTAVMATHDQEEALRLSDDMAVMHAGSIVQIGSPEEIMNHPANDFVAAFIGMETVIPGKVSSSERGVLTVSASGRDILAVGEAAPGEEVCLCIRPENVTLSTAVADRTSARNVFAASILRIIPKGLYYKIEMDCGFFLVAYVTRQSLDDLSLHAAQMVTASFKATAVHVILK